MRPIVERYVSVEEYASLFTTLTRRQVAEAIKPRGKVLDIAAGSAYFSIEAAKRHLGVQITAIDIYEGSVKEAKENIIRSGLDDRVKMLQMDASKLDFMDGSFDTVVNYLGLEDIYMTRGRRGVTNTFKEVFRVLKPDGFFFFVTMPPDLMETEAQRIETEVFSAVCDATWLTSKEYRELLAESGFKLLETLNFYTGLKLTPKQAREEIEYACINTPKHYGVKAMGFDEAWSRYGERIRTHGMGHYSKTVLFKAFKPDHVSESPESVERV